MVLFSTSALAEEKSITPQEFGNALKEVPGKFVSFIGNEVEKTKKHQKETWAEAKTKWPWNKIFKGDNND